MDQLTTNVRSQQWLQMIRDQKESGLSIQAWCRENNISENCFYYRQRCLRRCAGQALAGQFVEIQQPAAAPNHDNFIHNSAARITDGKLAVELSNQASQELISRIVRALNAQ